MKKTVAVLMIACVIAMAVACTQSPTGEVMIDPAYEGIVNSLVLNLGILVATPFIVLGLFAATFTLAGQALATL